RIGANADVRTVLIQSGRTHVRPILMTAAATILALIPLAFSSGGGLIAASLATVVIGGLLSSALLTLVVIPVIYSLFPNGWTAGWPASRARIVTLWPMLLSVLARKRWGCCPRAMLVT